MSDGNYGNPQLYVIACQTLESVYLKSIFIVHDFNSQRHLFVLLVFSGTQIY